MSPDLLDENLMAALDVFLGILRKDWSSVKRLTSRSDDIAAEAFMADWMQANWETLVEASVASCVASGGIFLEPYGDGADCNASSSRIWMPQMAATHGVLLRPHTGMKLWDCLMKEELEAVDEPLLLDRFVATTSDGWYVEAPPFDHALSSRTGREVMFRLTDITMGLTARGAMRGNHTIMQ